MPTHTPPPETRLGPFAARLAREALAQGWTPAETATALLAAGASVLLDLRPDDSVTTETLTLALVTARAARQPRKDA